MAKPTQNQAQDGPPVNVLHDQNVPNTLNGIGPIATTAGGRFVVAAFVAALVAIVVAVVIVVAR
jgi:hypothetical protein